MTRAALPNTSAREQYCSADSWTDQPGARWELGLLGGGGGDDADEGTDTTISDDDGIAFLFSSKNTTVDADDF